MPATASPTIPQPGADKGVDLRREVRRMHAGVLVFYLVDALLIGLYAACGTVPPGLGLWYAIAGLAVTETGFFWYRRRGSRAADVETLGAGLSLSTGVVMLATLGHSPQLGGLMLMSIMAVLTLSATHQTRRRQLSLCVLMAGGSVAVLALTGGGAGIPTAQAAECVLSGFWLAWLLAKASAHNITGTRLRQQVKEAHDELARALQDLEKVAATDELTLLPNRRAILASVQRAVAAGRQQGSPVGIALMDIDHFKRINDRHGHDIGDQVLREFGRVAALGLRPTDRVGRYGGEEFLLLLQQIDGVGAAAEVVERLRAGIAAHDWSRIAGGLAVTASAGVTLLLPGDDPAGAIRRADTALYEAKAQGRDRVVAAARPLMAQGQATPPLSVATHA
jgi:diguanylate cyclase (GGDEF)-like protein